MRRAQHAPGSLANHLRDLMDREELLPLAGEAERTLDRSGRAAGAPQCRLRCLKRRVLVVGLRITRGRGTLRAEMETRCGRNPRAVALNCQGARNRKIPDDDNKRTVRARRRIEMPAMIARGIKERVCPG